MVGGFVKSGGEMWQNSEIECQTILKAGNKPLKMFLFPNDVSWFPIRVDEDWNSRGFHRCATDELRMQSSPLPGRMIYYHISPECTIHLPRSYSIYRTISIIGFHQILCSRSCALVVHATHFWINFQYWRVLKWCSGRSHQNREG